MPAISWLIKKIAREYPELRFVAGEMARWSPTTHTVTYCPNDAHADWLLLHETAHALLGHTSYTRDITLLKHERDAWHYAEQLGARYGVTLDPAFADEQLDTYRDWLHAKSTCPACQSNGIQHPDLLYRCVHCHAEWRVNRGVDTAIRRYSAA